MDGIDVGPGLVVDGPRVELRAFLRANVVEGERHGLVGRGGGRGGSKLCVVPLDGCGIVPDGCAGFAGILDDDAEAHLARVGER